MPWWNLAWSYRLAFTVNKDLVDADLTDFPMLVYLNGTNIDWGDINPQLADLRFLDVNETVLNHEIDYYTANTEAYIWVKLPFVSSTVNTIFWMYYGNSQASSIENKMGVWNNDFVMVQHLKDKTVSTVEGSTTNAYLGTKQAPNNPTEDVGKIGLAQSFDGLNNYISFSALTDLTAGGSWTIQLLVNATSIITQDTRIFSNVIDANNKVTINQVEAQARMSVFNGATYTNIKSSVSLSAGEWFHLAGVSSAGSLKFYFQGVDTSVAGASKSPGSVGGCVLGALSDKNANFFYGLIDEVRVSKTDRSAAWIKASYLATTLGLIEEGVYEETVSVSADEALAIGFLFGFVALAIALVVYVKK